MQVIYDSLISLGIDEFTIWLNNRKILNGICKHFGIESQVNSILRVIDKIDKIGKDAVIAELSKIIDEKTARDLIETTSIKQIGKGADFFAEIAHLKAWNDELRIGIEELERVYALLGELAMDRDTYRVNFAIARGLGYYTGVVYETTLNRHRDLGSVCSGGRYDNLTATFSKEKISGVGASIGIDRLLAALEDSPKRQTSARVLLICLDSANFPYVYKIAESFRRSKIPSEVYPDIAKLKKSFAYANAKGHEFVAVIGDDEIKSGGITLKNMTSGMQMNGISLLKAIELLRA